MPANTSVSAGAEFLIAQRAARRRQYRRPSLIFPRRFAGPVRDLQHDRTRARLRRPAYPIGNRPAARAVTRWSYGRGGQRRARVGADALHHRTKAVRTLRRQMLAQAHLLEQGDRVGRENVVGVLAGKDREQDRRSVRARYARRCRRRNVSTGPPAPFGRTVVSSQTWLAQPCTLLASLWAAAGKRRQFPAELDQVAIAVVPVVEDREVVDDFVDVGHRAERFPRSALYIERRGVEGRCLAARLRRCADDPGSTRRAWRPCAAPARASGREVGGRQRILRGRSGRTCPGRLCRAVSAVPLATDPVSCGASASVKKS